VTLIDLRVGAVFAAAFALATAARATTEEPGSPVRPLPPAAEPEPRVTGLLEVAVASSYVWRGDLYSADRFDPIVTPYAEATVDAIGPGAVTVSLFGLLPTAGSPPLEVDPLVAWAVEPARWLSLSVGYTVYLGLDPLDDTMHELVLDTEWLGARTLHPVAGVAVDPVVTQGAYAYTGMAASLSSASLSLDAQLTGGISGYAGVALGVQDVTAQAVGSMTLAGPLYASLTGGVGLAPRTADTNPFAALALGAAF